MQLPERIGKYQIEEYLGGGMAEVYRAVDCVLHRTVAFKRLSPQGVADPTMRERFLAEARLGSQVDHPNIVKTLDYCEDGAAPYLVLEFLRGRSLSKLIKEATGGSVSNRVRIALESARSLEHVHSMGILHRDIKPDNIHVDERGTARLIDFGIAKSADMNMTTPGMVIGTPYYMPPEQVRGEPANPRTDIYSFGLVLFELLSGVRARSGETMVKLMEEIMTKTVSFEPLTQANIPQDLRAIVENCAAQDPSKRPESFTVVVSWLEAWLAANPVTGPAPTVSIPLSKASPSPASWIIGIAAMLLTGIAGGFGVTKYIESQTAGAHRGGVLLPSGAWIDRLEVNNEQYKRFARATKRTLPAEFESDSPGRPVVNVTAKDADAYCAWLGKRLPTEVEWIEAAGPHAFPWGDKAEATHANVADNPEMKGHLVAADAMSDTASPLGVLQLAGNAAEWMADVRAPSQFAVDGFANLLTPPPAQNEEWRIVKGGSFAKSLAQAASKEWMPAPARYSAKDVGFRCIVPATK